MWFDTGQLYIAVNIRLRFLSIIIVILQFCEGKVTVTPAGLTVLPLRIHKRNPKCDQIYPKCDQIYPKCDQIYPNCDQIYPKCDQIYPKCDQIYP